MKKQISNQPFILFIIAALMGCTTIFAQAQQLPEIKMPDIPYKPKTSKGWIGQFVYEFHFNDSTSIGKGKNRKYTHIIVARTNTGYVELSNEVRGAIRSNQPDKNNTQRYECWINSGTKNSWNMHDETDTLIEPSASMYAAANNPDAVTGRIEKYSRYNSENTWVKGWIENTDLQIDHSTGKYSFGVPLVTYNLEGDETLNDITYKPAKSAPRKRKENKSHTIRSVPVLVCGDWGIIEGSFKEGQKEIIIRERIPVTLILSQQQGAKSVSSPAKKGFIDFYLVLKRIG